MLVPLSLIIWMKNDHTLKTFECLSWNLSQKLKCFTYLQIVAIAPPCGNVWAGKDCICFRWCLSNNELICCLFSAKCMFLSTFCTFGTNVDQLLRHFVRFRGWKQSFETLKRPLETDLVYQSMLNAISLDPTATIFGQFILDDTLRETVVKRLPLNHRKGIKVEHSSCYKNVNVWPC